MWMDYINRFSVLWLPVGFSQWDSSGKGMKGERGWGMDSPGSVATFKDYSSCWATPSISSVWVWETVPFSAPILSKSSNSSLLSLALGYLAIPWSLVIMIVCLVM